MSLTRSLITEQHRPILGQPPVNRFATGTGIGAIGTAALGIYLFNEPATLLRLAFIGLILTGIVGLKITS